MEGKQGIHKQGSLIHIIGAYGKESDSPTEMGQKRKQQHINFISHNHAHASQCHYDCKLWRMHYSLAAAVRFHMIPEVKRRANMWQP